MRFKVVFLLVLLFSCTIVSAQKVEMVSKNLPAYEGTWQYTTSTDTFILVLKKGISDSKSVKKDCLVGLYYYKQNRQVLNNYLNKWDDFSLIARSKRYPVFATNADYQSNYEKIDPNCVDVTFRDYNQPEEDRQGSAKIELVVGKPNEAVWTIVYRKREVVNVEGLPDITPSKPVYILPDTMVLKKIK